VTALDETPNADPAALAGHTVTFDDLGKAGVFTSSSAVLDADGQCSVQYTPAPGDGGTTTVRATLEPSGLHGITITDASLTVMRRQTTTTISLDASDVYVDKPMTVTVMVTDVTPGVTLDPPRVTPQGIVEFSTPDDGEFAPSSCVLTPTSTTCTTQYTPRGATGESLSGHSLLANYYDSGLPSGSGLVRHEESSDNVTLSVLKRPTRITLSVAGADPKNAELYDTFTITATVSDNLSGSPAFAPSGYVYFYDSSKFVPSASNWFARKSLSSGAGGESNDCVATFTISEIETPFHIIQVRYAGDARFQLSGQVYDQHQEKPGIFLKPLYQEDEFVEPDLPPSPPGVVMSAPGRTAPLLSGDCGCGKKGPLAIPYTKIITAYNIAKSIVEASKIGVEVPPDPLVDATDPVEASFDVVLFILKTDWDGDGFYTGIETIIGLNPLTGDTDKDGISEPDEISAASGWFGPDAWPNPWLSDTDGDGLKDGDELANYQTDLCCCDSDHDGIGDGAEVGRIDAELRHQSNALEPDTDSDGIGDWFEFGKVSPYVNDADSDDDGLQDGAEDNGGVPIRDYIGSVDSIGDYIQGDAFIVYYNVFTGVRMQPGNHLSQCVGETHFSMSDTDGDGLQDGEEVGLFGLAVVPDWVPMRGEPGMTVPALDSDIDNDGLTDAEELYIYQTDPTNQDTDGDTLYDGLEVATWNEAIALRLMGLGFETQNWYKKGGVIPNNPGDHASPSNADTDGDGFGDEIEYFLGCNCGVEGFGSRDGYVNNPDSDNDQLPDKLDAEQLIPPGPDGNPREPGSDVALAYGNNGELEPDGPDAVCAVCDPDSDNDGLPDGLELSLGTRSTDWDSDDDGLSDYEEIMIYGTNPNDTDTDDDLAGEDIGDDKGFFESRTPTLGIPLPGHPSNECVSSQGETRMYSEGEGCIRCMSDCEEVLSHAGVWPFQFPRDQSDPLNPDTDADGLRDDAEFPPGCNGGEDGFVNNADSDDDSLQDGADAILSLYDVLGAGADSVVEGVPYSVPGNDGELHDDILCSICDTDSDGDGLSDGEELHLGTDALDWDQDDDGLSDR